MFKLLDNNQWLIVYKKCFLKKTKLIWELINKVQHFFIVKQETFIQNKGKHFSLLAELFDNKVFGLYYRQDNFLVVIKMIMLLLLYFLYLL